ncbi:MAG: lactate utilization protein [Candidatus Ventricola sp.]
MNEKLEKVASALRRRGFEAAVFDTRAQAVQYILGDLPEKQEIGMGGSATLAQMNLSAALREAGHTVHWHQGAPAGEGPAIRRAAMCAQAYFASANAVTEDGLIVQIDGTGNRVAALCYGPETVYIVIGRNKIVEGGYQQAVRRIKQVACPLNARRLHLDTPCASTGSCDVSACTHSMCHLFLAMEGAPGGKRTQVILIDEELGF